MTRRIASRISILFALAAAGVLAACGASTATPSGETGDGGTPAQNNDAGDAEAGFGCCPLPASPPTCPNMGHIGGSKRVAEDACANGPIDSVNDPTVPGWKVTNDDGGCPIWTPPQAAGFVSCQIIPDASAE